MAMWVRKLRMLGCAAASMLMAGLLGCAAGPRAELSEGAANQIRTVALLDIAEPSVDQVLNRGNGNESHSTTYATLLPNAQVALSPLLAEAITRTLERHGYRVANLPPQRPVLRPDGHIALSP